MKDFTIILLTHEREEFARRSMRYYLRFGCKILVFDSSLIDCSESYSSDSSVTYFWVPGCSFSKKISEAVKVVGTDFFAFASDDDFVTESGCRQSLDFLRKNNDFSFCHGRSLFYLPSKIVNSYFFRERLVKSEFSESGLSDRISSFFDYYIPPFYAVLRTSVARKIPFDKMDILSLEYQEFFHAFALLLHGKGKILDTIYVIRESNYVTSDHGTDMLTMLSGRAPDSAEKRKTCVSFLKPIVSEYTGKSTIQSAALINDCIDLVVDCLSTGRSLTLQRIFTSNWEFAAAEPRWHFEAEQFVEMPIYSKEFFAFLNGIDFLMRVYPAGKLQQIELKDIFDRRKKVFADFERSPSKHKLHSLFDEFHQYPFDYDSCMFIKKYVLETQLVEYLANNEVFFKWIEQVESAFNPSNFLPTPPEEYVYPSQRKKDGKGSADTDGWLGRRDISDEYYKCLGEMNGFTSLAIVLKEGAVSAEAQAFIDSFGFVEPLHSKISVSLWIPAGLSTVGQDSSSFFEVKEYSRLADVVERSADDFVCLVSASDRLLESALFMLAVQHQAVHSHAAICFDAAYSAGDEEQALAFKPDLSLDYLLSFPAAFSRHWLFNRKALLDIGGFDTSLPDAFELDAIFRLINKHGLDKLGHIPEPLVITQPPALANVDDERIAIERHLRERGYEHAQVHAPNPGRYQIRYNHPQQPVVSIVLAAGKSLDKLQRCVEGLLGNTSYQTFEILFIDQPGSGNAVKQWLAELAAMQEPKLRVHATNRKTLAEQYNEAHELVIGDYLLFLSADVAVISEHWLDEMLNHAQRGEVGVVGAKLLSSDGKIAHAGYILGLHGPVGSPFVGEPLDEPGYMQRLQVDQNLSAVGGDCMMVLKQLFTELGGFDTSGLADVYLSTDFCLRSREAGFLTVWTPHAQLMLDQAAKPAPDNAAEDLMYDKWLPQLARDPAYNPNFSLSMPGGYMLADSQISWRPLDSIRPAPVALVHPADLFGCGHYRVMQPFLAMKEAGLVDGAISTGLMHVTDLERYNPDTIILQRQIGDARLEAMRRMQRFSRAVKVYELDDYLPNLPLKSVHRKDMPKDIVKSLRRGLSFVDRFVVSTHAMAEAFAGMHGEIVVCENRLPMSWWDGLQTKRRQGKKPRVGWAGGSSHTGDLELIADVVRDLADEVEWVFFGMCPEALKPYVHEFHGGVAIEQYPAKLASLNLDLGLAPLEHNLFNECKSNLRQLEYGACGIPIICTDIRPYQDGLNAGLPVTLVKNRYKDWVDAIRMHINDLDATARMADELQAKVKADWMLQGRYLEDWRNAWLGN